MTRTSDVQYRSGLTALVAVWLLFGVGSARAETISYSLTLSEDLSVLEHPNNPIVAQNAALKTQHTLMLERTMPYVELRNTSGGEAEITQFTMTIGDVSKNFDWGKLVTASPGVTFSLASPDAVAGQLSTDLLVVNFTNFGPGDFVRFRVGLSPDSDSDSAIMDYRTVLYQMNGGSDTSNNATINVSFSGNEGADTLTQQLPNFSNNNKFTSTNLIALTTTCGMDSINPVTTGGQGPSQAVPEPGSMALLAIGLLGLALRGLPRRRG